MPIRRQFQIPRRSPRAAKAEPDTPSLASAEADVRRVFAARPRPYSVRYCPCCFEPREMAEFLVTRPENLSADRLEAVIVNAYWTWGDWPALAHYVPRLLELYARSELADVDAFFYKLLLTSRPELIPTVSTQRQAREFLGELMRPEERKAIFGFVRSVADTAMADPDLTAGVERVCDAFSFLAAFDAPLSPVLEAWKRSRNEVVRGRYCLFLAEWVPRYDPAQPLLKQGYLKELAPHPGNVRTLARLVEPAAVAAHLWGHLSDVERFDPDLQTSIETALDWLRYP